MVEAGPLVRTHMHLYIEVYAHAHVHVGSLKSFWKAHAIKNMHGF